MLLYIGGKYQGKLDAALSKIDAKESEILDLSKIKNSDDFRNLNSIKPENAKIIYKVEELVRFIVINECSINLLDDDTNLCTKEIIKEYIIRLVNITMPAAVIVSEVGAGVIPMDRRENDFREITGEIAAELAKCSEGVIRVICGIEQKIK